MNEMTGFTAGSVVMLLAAPGRSDLEGAGIWRLGRTDPSIEVFRHAGVGHASLHRARRVRQEVEIAASRVDEPAARGRRDVTFERGLPPIARQHLSIREVVPDDRRRRKANTNRPWRSG